jgi:hypothetical protein
MTVTRNWILLTIVVAACGALAQHSQPLPAPTVLYPDPFRFSYPHTAQVATVLDIGKVEILPAGKVKVEVKFRADGGWAYACNAPSENYIRTLKRGDRVSIRPDAKFVRLKTQGKHLRLKIIDVDRWGSL